MSHYCVCVCVCGGGGMSFIYWNSLQHNFILLLAELHVMSGFASYQMNDLLVVYFRASCIQNDWCTE